VLIAASYCRCTSPGHPASRGAEEFNAVITITCLVGNRIPVGAEESVEFGIPGVIDFDAR